MVWILMCKYFSQVAHSYMRISEGARPYLYTDIKEIHCLLVLPFLDSQSMFVSKNKKIMYTPVNPILL